MIPFCKTNIGQEEMDAVISVIKSGWIVQGPKTREFEEKFAEYVGAKHCIFVDSGTSALDLSVKYCKMLFNLKFLYVPSLTFTSSAEVIIHNDIQLKWLDVNRDNFCVESPYESTIQVHLTGNKANSKGIIEDSAHRIEKDQCKGNRNFVCFSFYATKNMTTIQGGMIATNDDDAAKWLRMARDHGISKGTEERYKNGNWRYSIDFVGWREKSDDIHAAVGLEQLKKLPQMTERRNEIVARYNQNFNLNRTGNHLYPVLVNDRDKFIEQMKEAGIQTSVHFLPLHQMPAYQKYYNNEILTNTEYLGERLCSLPLFYQLTDEEIDFISQEALKTNLLI